MKHDLATIRELIARLADHGIQAVCVGGAARDVFLGRVPKDYDLIILDHAHSEYELKAAIQDCTGAANIYDLSEQGMGSEGTSDSDGDADVRGVAKVYEVRICGGEFIHVQFIVYKDETLERYEGDPAYAVAEHDCSLNMAWFEEVDGQLKPRVHSSFPVSGNPDRPNVFSGRHVNYDRKAYIRDKFPEFTHQF